MWLYIFGVGVFSLHLLAQIISMLWKVYTHTDQIQDEDYTIVNVHAEIDPCSFFRYIFINPTNYDYETYEQILAHEKVHVRQRHSFDLLLAECAVILLWFNPFIWILRKEIEKNIEYQTDDISVKGKTEEKEQYQLNLLKVATHTQPLSITTNYNQSSIKQRILKDQMFTATGSMPL